MAKVIVITVDGKMKTIDSLYDNLSESVQGYIEYVCLSTKIGKRNGIKYDKELPDLHIYLNEEGKILNLPVNPFATALWQKYYKNSDTIVGNIIITGGADEEGETTDTTEEQIKFVKSIIDAVNDDYV